MADTGLSQVGPYSIIRLLQSGPAWHTYLGKHTVRSRTSYTILKVLRAPLNTDEAKEDFLTRARQIKKLKHRNIAELLEAGLVPENGSELGYIAYQYVQGVPIYERFEARERYKPDEVKRVLTPIADALQYAHAMHIVHGNLHPGNILVDERNNVMLTDFSFPGIEISAALPYMAPEQLRGETLAASDQYALAVMAYEWLCGQRPYPFTDRDALLKAQEHEPIPAPRTLNSDISPTLEQVLLKALAVQPNERYPHTLTFSDTYLRALMGFPIPPNIMAPKTVQPEQDVAKPANNGPGSQPITPATKNSGSETTQTKPETISPKPKQANTREKKPAAQVAKTDKAGETSISTPKTPEKEATPPEPVRPKVRRFSTGVLNNLQQEVTRDLQQGGILSKRLPGYEERPEQIEMAQVVAGALIEEKHAIIEASTGTGKALDVDTPIPTPSGWKRMGDLVVGDYVFDEKGYPTRVIAAFDIMYGHKCYEVEFSDGSRLIADAEHEWASYTATDRQWPKRPKSNIYQSKNFITADSLLLLEQTLALSTDDHALSIDEAKELIGGHHWSISQAARQIAPVNFKTRPARYPQRQLLTAVKDRLAKDLIEQRRDKRAYTLVTTEQMAATLRVHSSQRANHAIAVASPLKLPEVNLPIAPYFLGVWLGDGSSRSNQITTADPDLITEIEKDGYIVRSLSSHPYLYAVDDENGKALHRWKPGMTGRLRTLGLLLNKHIPTIYLRSSEGQRRALLAGLLDTDGTVSRTGAIEFTTINQQLAEGAFELACSLGYRATLRAGRAHFKLKDCGPKWTLSFTTDEQVFRLPRKVKAHRERLRNYTPERNRFRYVTAIREVPTRPVRCIQVDSESHLYLAGRSMIPTHNSLAYLLPIVRSGRGAIISTANKALQEQLFYKDIPFIKKHVQDFEAALVKGMGNYICLDRLETQRKEGQPHTKHPDFTRLLSIVNEFELTISGDFETLGFTVPAEIRSLVNAERDECAWTECPLFSKCYVRQMKERAEEAQVVVVNHTLLLLDAATNGHILPQREVMVVDEAHHLEEEATRAFTVTVSQSQIYALLSLRRLREHSSPSLQEEAKKQMLLAWDALERIANPGFKGRANLHETVEDGLKLATVIDQLASSLEMQRPLFMPDKENTLYDKLVNRTRSLAANIRLVFSANQPEKFVYYVERVQQRSRHISPFEVAAAPLDVTEWLKEFVFNKTHVIATSATLTTTGQNPIDPSDKGPSFVYFRRRVGLDYATYPNVLESILPLTFDYENNALLYLPRHLPLPNYGAGSIDYMKAIASEMMRLAQISRGRAFLLFSSKRMLDFAFDEFLTRLPNDSNLRLLRQGDMTRIELVRTFRETEGAVLFGLKSFWEGVDIAGEALSLVVIDKMPFDPPDDPVQEARVAQMKARGEDWFGAYVLPQAVLRLKQGLGRLLRTREDRGVMAILDARLHKKGYGKLVLNALPPARQTSDIGDVERFFGEGDVPF
ncbi:MAG TPA: helicase C-terminal domain-containing protein [Ktedonobacteraceae bacterium]|jgi:Rad3-related DNA helicase|nr:helicase C-terminal domain-containing protein [Ktedonobacteraceae bacterium]